MATWRRMQVKCSIGGAFCVLLLVVGVAPNRAQAGCGHDVTSSESRLIRDALADMELFHYPARDRLTDCPGAHARGRAPARHALREQGLPQVPVPSLSLRSDLWCCMTIATDRIGRKSAHALDTSSRPHPRHETFPPERPPAPPCFAPLTRLIAALPARMARSGWFGLFVEDARATIDIARLPRRLIEMCARTPLIDSRGRSNPSLRGSRSAS